MPNGRTSSFSIGREQLKDFLSAVPVSTVIGKAGEHSVTAGHALILVDKHRQKDVAVEEQDDAWYIIPLSTWISVDATSELYGRLRLHHAKWLKELACSGFARQRASAGFERVGDHVRGPLIVVKFSGVYPPGSAGNTFAEQMLQFLRGVLIETSAAGVLFDLTNLDYTYGDAIGNLAVPFLSDRRAAVVATGPTARALAPLFESNFIFGVTGLKLVETREEALEHIQQALHQTAVEPKVLANDRARFNFQGHEKRPVPARGGTQAAHRSTFRVALVEILRGPLAAIVLIALGYFTYRMGWLWISLGWLLIGLGTVYFALKVAVARSHATGSGGGAPFLDGALIAPLMWCFGLLLLKNVYTLRFPFRGFVFACWIVLTAGSAVLLLWASRPRPISRHE